MVGVISSHRAVQADSIAVIDSQYTAPPIPILITSTGMRPFLFLLVFVGGGIGSMARYAMATVVQRSFPGPFPIGTFLVNLAGCFAIGFFGALGLERSAISPETRTFIMVGILGGFTTFSSFTWESLGLLDVKDLLRASLYVGGSVFCGLVGTFIGRSLGRIGT